MKWKRIAAGVVAGAASLLTIRATAQLEMAPDYVLDSFVGQAGPHARPAGGELNSRSAVVRQELDECQEQIAVQTELVAEKRELADGAGGMGEFGAVFIDEYVEQYRELERLKRTLAPRIAMAKASLEQLEQHLPDSSQIVAPPTARQKRIAARPTPATQNRRSERPATATGTTPASSAAKR